LENHMQTLKQIAAAQERAVLRQFQSIIQSIRDQAVIQEVVRALEVGDVSAVVNLLDISESRFEPLYESIRQAYRTGGLTGAEQIGRIPTPDGTLVMRFNARSPAAEQWLTDMSSRLIVEVVDQQREMVRNVLTQNIAQGRNPRASALDIIGRVDQRTGKRSGGFIGLTDQQAGWVSSARDKLESLDPDYFNMQLRDKRFDGAISRAIDSGDTLPQSLIDNAVTRYQARAERYRGETIARTESISALRSGQNESIRQAVEVGELDTQDVTKVWDATGDSRTRLTHIQADGQRRAFDEPFNVGGSDLMYPGDPSGPASETIQCRCIQRVVIDFSGRLKRVEGFG
jgi:hypothetical protein